MIEAMIGAGAGLLGASMTNSAQTAASKKQMQFQRYMSNTAYQRSAKDLEKAGLNRILAIGSPASTPAGAQPTLQNLGQAMTSGGLAGATAARASAEAKQQKIQAGMDARMINEYKSMSPASKKIVDRAMLAKKAGVKPELLIGVTAGADAGSKIGNYLRGVFVPGKTVSGGRKYSDGHYEKAAKVSKQQDEIVRKARKRMELQKKYGSVNRGRK